MTRKFLASVSALVLGAALSTSAFAQVSTDNTSADNGSNAGVVATDASTDNSNTGNNNSTNDLSNNSTTDASWAVSDSGNDNSDNSNQGNDYSDNSNQGNDYSDNSDNSTTTVGITATLSLQNLQGTVTGAPVYAEGGNTQGGRDRTGAISADGGSYSAYAGIMTANNNTGLNSQNQAATSLAANADISFGAPSAP
jgi:hypothetical protein